MVLDSTIVGVNVMQFYLLLYNTFRGECDAI